MKLQRHLPGQGCGSTLSKDHSVWQQKVFQLCGTFVTFIGFLHVIIELWDKKIITKKFVLINLTGPGSMEGMCLKRSLQMLSNNKRLVLFGCLLAFVWMLISWILKKIRLNYFNCSQPPCNQLIVNLICIRSLKCNIQACAIYHHVCFEE